MKNKIKQLPILIILIFSLSLYGNNLQVENIALTGQDINNDYTMVQFDISWDNSWRDIVNWDAAWVFVKYKINNGEWIVAFLSVTDGNHTAPAGAVINNGNNGGIYAPGVFIYRDANGAGSNDWNSVQLRWNYGDNGVADADLVTVKVFAIEMVYVPAGTFDLGDGSGGATPNHFYNAGNGNLRSFTVNAQNTIITSSTGIGNLWAAGAIDAGESNVNFPTGFNAFYCMKYEITQEQYVDFLNTLTRTQQNTRTETDISGTSITNRYVMANLSTIFFRNGIRCDAILPASGPITLYCDYNGNDIGNENGDGQNIACNFLSWMDDCAYAAWAGLRPMTELEFEKASRGNQTAVAGEYAWGNVNIYASVYTLSNAGIYNEIISGQPTGTGNASYSVTAGSINGPLRAGVFALVSTTRQEAGASYYGIMQLSGNLQERTVTIGNINGRIFTGNHGGGGLSANGNANGVANWPGWDGSEVTGAAGSGLRAGSFLEPASVAQVSNRSVAAIALEFRATSYGFRCVRTAP